MTAVTVLLLAACAFLVSVPAPRWLARATWPHRAPRVALAVWGALALSSVLTVVAVLTHLAAPDGWITDCVGTVAAAVSEPGGPGLRVGLPLAVAAAMVARLAWMSGAGFVEASRERRRHAATLALVGDRRTRPGLTVLDHNTPAVYCVPGRARSIVVTTGALAVLDGPCLEAVVAHEKAHLRGRHHIVLTLAQAFRRAFPWVPLAAGCAAAVPLLVEMTADDHAARGCGRRVLASALYAVATGDAPKAALPAANGDADVLVRITRLLKPVQPFGGGRRTAVLALAGTLVLLPLATACGVR